MSKIVAPEEFQLSNGIPVILQHYDGAVAATYWWNNVGSADERPSEAGFAHFLEHMLFKDTSAKETGRASTGQMAREIESLGGDINAYTSMDQTVYHVTCAEQHWERVLDVFGTMAKPQKFLKEDFTREREVILEELRKNEDSPGRQLFESLFGATFKKHPYGKPVIGTVKILKAATATTLEAFYNRNYVSSAMGIILVGPFDDKRKKTVLALLEKRFGGKVIPRRPRDRAARPAEEAHRPVPHVLKRHFDIKSPTMAFSFRVPEIKHADVPALDLLSGVMGMGELSRLYQRLFYTSALATEVSAGLYIPGDAGLLYFQVEMEDVSKIADATRAAFEEIARMRVEPPTRAELDRVITNVESERLYATQTADGMASRLGFMRFTIGDMNYDRSYLEHLKSLTEDDVREVCKEYLDPRRLSGVVLVPNGEKKFDHQILSKIATDALKPMQRKQAAVARKSAVRLIKRDSGIRVAYLERPSSHVFSIHASVLGGTRLELADPVELAEKDWGASHMMAMTWHKGTSTRSSKEISAIVEGKAAGIEGFSGRNSVGAQMTGLARDWGQLSELFSEVLIDPTFPGDEVEHSRRVALDSIKSIEDHSGQLCSKLFLESLFEHHPYGKLLMGSEESIKAMASGKLRDFHRRWLRPERLVLSVSGAVKEAEFEAWLSALEKELHSRTSGGVPHPVLNKVPEEALLKGPRWVERSVNREQAHIIVGGLGTRLDSPDRHAMRVMQTLLGGQSGRLFIELREKKSLAYTVAPTGFEGIEKGYTGTYIACSPLKSEEALKGIRVVLEKLAKSGPSAAEMKRAREYYLGQRAMDLQGDSSLASYYGLETLYGHNPEHDDERIKQILKVTPQSIKDVCRKYLVDAPMVTSIVG